MADVAQGVLRELERLAAEGLLRPEESATLRAQANRLDSVSRTLQQLVRFGSGLVIPAPERVDLTAVVREGLRDHSGRLEAMGVEVSFNLKPVEVDVDPVAARQLVDAALDWASAFGQRIRIKVEPELHDQRARLTVRGSLPAAGKTRMADRDRRMNHNLHWMLMRQIGALSGLAISRSSTGATESVVVEFEHAYGPDRNVSCVELLGEGEDTSGAWVLAVIADRALRENVLRLLLRQGVDVSVAENWQQARLLCTSRKPRVLVGCPRSGDFATLREEWARGGHRCTLIRLAPETMDRDLVPGVLFGMAAQD